jgi:N-acyl-D-aspartate/D-glutamate deacylase
MSYDLIIKNGTVVDGTGAPPVQADVAIARGKIAGIGRIHDGAQRVIDAGGLIVAPGFVDPHTHYDAQICWDPLVTSTSMAWGDLRDHGKLRGRNSAVQTGGAGDCGVGPGQC